MNRSNFLLSVAAILLTIVLFLVATSDGQPTGGGPVGPGPMYWYPGSGGTIYTLKPAVIGVSGYAGGLTVFQVDGTPAFSVNGSAVAIGSIGGSATLTLNGVAITGSGGGGSGATTFRTDDGTEAESSTIGDAPGGIFVSGSQYGPKTVASGNTVYLVNTGVSPMTISADTTLTIDQTRSRKFYVNATSSVTMPPIATPTTGTSIATLTFIPVGNTGISIWANSPGIPIYSSAGSDFKASDAYWVNPNVGYTVLIDTVVTGDTAYHIARLGNAPENGTLMSGCTPQRVGNGAI